MEGTTVKTLMFAALAVALAAGPAAAQIAIQGQGQQQGQGQFQSLGGVNNQIGTSSATGGTSSATGFSSATGGNIGEVYSGSEGGSANIGEVYSGAEVYIGGGATPPNLIQLPGLIGAMPNFSQPYKPDVFVNGAGAVRPTTMTFAQAESCAKGLGFWGVNGDYVGDSRNATTEITLYYPAWDKVAPTGDMSAYIGTSMLRAKDKPWLPTLCAAAKLAMERGADVGVVEYIIRPVNKVNGFMISASVGGAGMPAGGATPYALAGTLGAGIGTSSTFVQGELMLQVTGMTKGSVKSARGEPEYRPAAFEASGDEVPRLAPSVLQQSR
jgi:hypothetical protein